VGSRYEGLNLDARNLKQFCWGCSVPYSWRALSATSRGVDFGLQRNNNDDRALCCSRGVFKTPHGLLKAIEIGQNSGQR
jgi:hypothetical protein